LRAHYDGWRDVDTEVFSVFLRGIVLPNTMETYPDWRDPPTAWAGAPCDAASAHSRWNYNDKTNWATWGMVNRMSIAVFTDAPILFEQSVHDAQDLIEMYIGCEFHSGDHMPCTEGAAGMILETCALRGGAHGDLHHAQMGTAPLVVAAEIASKHGVDLYRHVDPSGDDAGVGLRAGLLFIAPFVGFPARGSDETWPCDAPLDGIRTGPWHFWEIAYRHYGDPEMRDVALSYRPSTRASRIGFDTLTHGTAD